METQKNLAENPNTAIASESESEPPTPTVATPTKKRKKRKHRRFAPNYDIPGVHKLVLPELTQQVIGCIAGDTVTVEHPWIRIEKEAIQEHLESHTESSEFLPIKNEIQEYPGNDVLMGYIPDESRDYDEFYICVTEQATEQVSEIVEKVKKIQQDRLDNAINRKVKKWKPLGSDQEVEEVMVKYHRSLIEVEIESKYPILPFKIHFRLLKSQDLRDGYMELRPSDEGVATIYRKRIDASIQVAPSVLTNEAQTICTYPKNSFTQYEYKLQHISAESTVMKVQDFISGNLDSFCDILKVNGCIDLYSNDYENLVINEKYAIKVMVPHPKEYFCFIDMNLSGGKMISCISWHAMWSGCVVLSYVDLAPSIYVTSKSTTDEVFTAVHDTNPVLFWSFTDDLKPKLILETPRPVFCLSCCPYDPNLIMGGCVNGQLILWDITNKLNYVEEEEILTINQQKYRDYLFSLMNWMKNIFDLALVRPTAISDLKYSHRGCVNNICWMSPFHSTTKTGKLEPHDETTRNSLELITSAEDGTIMIWDLLRKPVTTPGGFKAVRKLKRLKKRPSALSVMESPFKILHLNLKPVYKINLINPTENNRLIGISSFCVHFIDTEYDQTSTENRKNAKLSERFLFKPVLNKENSFGRQTFYVGTMEGEYIQGRWEGQEFDSGEIVNFEECDYVNYGKYHDGPVVAISYSPLGNTILTVGGKIFALWREEFKNRPLLWRKSESIYTSGSWFEFEKGSIKLTRMDGYEEVWTLFYKSKEQLALTLMSNGAATTMTTHPRRLKYYVSGLSDYRGSFRLFYHKVVSPVIIRSKEEQMSVFLTQELTRKMAFLEWQDKWNKAHKVEIEAVEAEKEEQVAEASQPKQKQEKKKIVKISPGQRYLEMVQEQHRVNEQARIKSIILMKKQLDTEDLLKKREPLRKLEEENEFKKKKQKIKLKESDKIFKDQVAMLFPDVVKEKPAPPPDPYEDTYSEDHKKINFDDYYTIAESANTYVEEHPFVYDFSWGSVLKMGRERRKKLDDSVDKDNHRLRFATVKEEKVKHSSMADGTLSPDMTSVATRGSFISMMSKNTVVYG